MRILVADGDENCLKGLEVMLGAQGFVVYGTDSGEEATELGKRYDYDCIVLGDTADVSLNDVIRALRAAKCKTPIIGISSAGAVSALDCGADDFLVGFAPHKDELVARIRAVVRRSRGHASSVLSCGPLTIDLNTQRATVDGRPIVLTSKLFKMLEILLLNQGRHVTRERIMNRLYDSADDEPGINILSVFVCKLRKVLPKGLLQTVWDRGYMIVEPGATHSPAVGPEIREAFADGLGGYGKTLGPACLSERSVWEIVG